MPLLAQRKAKLIQHIRHNTFVELRKSPIDGVGVFALVDIPAGVDPYATNGPPSGSTIDLNEDEVNALPRHVAERIRKFITPHLHASGGRKYYGVPEAGLNALDVSHHGNSVGNALERQNLALDELNKDDRGYTRLCTTRNVHAGEELLVPYEIHITGRGRGGIDIDNGRDQHVVDEGAGFCRICREEIDPALPPSETVDIQCQCTSSVFHAGCCRTWFASRIQVILTQDDGDDAAVQEVGKPRVDNRWRLEASVKCELCLSVLSKPFTQELLQSAPGQLASTLAKTTNSDRAVSVSVTEVRTASAGPPVRRTSVACGKGGTKGAAPRAPRVVAPRPMPLGDAKKRPLASAPAGSPEAWRPVSARAQEWPAGKRVRIWMDDDQEFVTGWVVKYVTPAQRDAMDARGSTDAVCRKPRRRRGMYLLRWPVRGGARGEEDEDFFSEDDFGVEAL